MRKVSVLKSFSLQDSGLAAFAAKLSGTWNLCSAWSGTSQTLWFQTYRKGDLQSKKNAQCQNPYFIVCELQLMGCRFRNMWWPPKPTSATSILYIYGSYLHTQHEGTQSSYENKLMFYKFSKHGFFQRIMGNAVWLGHWEFYVRNAKHPSLNYSSLECLINQFKHDDAYSQFPSTAGCLRRAPGLSELHIVSLLQNFQGRKFHNSSGQLHSSVTEHLFCIYNVPGSSPVKGDPGEKMQIRAWARWARLRMRELLIALQGPVSKHCPTQNTPTVYLVHIKQLPLVAHMTFPPLQLPPHGRRKDYLHVPANWSPNPS